MKRTVEYMELSEDLIDENNKLEEGWYYVQDDLQVVNRIIINGTVNIILGDGCTLEVQKGIEVPEDQTLNIYAQSAGDDKGSLVASIGEGGDTIRGVMQPLVEMERDDDQFYGTMQSWQHQHLWWQHIEAHGNMGRHGG